MTEEKRKLAEENQQLRKEKAFLRSILDNIHEGIYATDENDIVVVHNRASEKRDGVPESEVLGLSDLDVFADTGWYESIIAKVKETGKPLLNTFFRQHHNDRIIEVIVDSYPFYYNNKLSGVYSICWDKGIVRETLNFVQGLQKSLVEQSENISTKEVFLLDDIVGSSQLMQDLISQAKTVAGKDSSVFIIGGTGTGKELFAKGIHYESINRHGPFIPINCAAIPDTLMESILFGTVRGSFTGAVDTPGLFEQANNGTIFLDEIDSMPKSLQSKLLRVLQEKRVRRVGSSKEIPINCRILSATNIDPLAHNEDALRSDLFFRLAVVTLHLPSLMERKSDIPLLCQHFINKYNRKFNSVVSNISTELESIFMNYSWPGNVRELENIIESGMNFVDQNEEILDIEHIPRYIRDKLTKETKDVDSYSLSPYKNVTLREAIQDFEKKTIMAALENNNWHMTNAAEDLGILRQNLYHKMKSYSIEKPHNKN